MSIGMNVLGVTVTIIDSLKVTRNTDDQWVTRLRNSHFVWLVIEKQYAQVEWAWEPPNPGTMHGRLGIKKVSQENGKREVEGSISRDVNPDGKRGNLLILLPVEGNCPDDPPLISEPWQRYIERTLATLTLKVEDLEDQLCRRDNRDVRDWDLYVCTRKACGFTTTQKERPEGCKQCGCTMRIVE